MITPIAIIIIAICWAMEDILQYHHRDSIFKNSDQYSFWGRDSWIRKYKHGNNALGPKFFGSTTFLVWLTDGWHLVKFIWTLAVFVAIFFGKGITNHLPWYWNLLEITVWILLCVSIYQLFHNFILRKR